MSGKSRIPEFAPIDPTLPDNERGIALVERVITLVDILMGHFRAQRDLRELLRWQDERRRAAGKEGG